MRRPWRAGSPSRRAPRPRCSPPSPARASSGAGLVYTVARPLAVPSDGGPHKTLVASSAADASLDYLTVPALAPEAYSSKIN